MRSPTRTTLLKDKPRAPRAPPSTTQKMPQTEALQRAFEVQPASVETEAGHARLLADPRFNGGGGGQSVRMLQQLQRAYGNAHASRVIAELHRFGAARNGPAPALAVQLQAAATACPAPPKEPVKTTPEQDPKFQAVTTKFKKQSKDLKQHPSAKSKAEEAKAAAVPPTNDTDSQAKAAQVDKMGGAKPGTFDKAAFIEAVNKAIADASPKNLEEADNFAKSGKAGEVKNKVLDKVTKGKEDSSKDVKEKSAEAPDASKAKPKPVTPMPEEKPGPKPPDPQAGKAMPAPAPKEQTDLRAGKCETEGKMAEAGVTEDQLKKSNEPEFQQAVDAKKEGEAHSAKAPAEVKAQEQQTLGKAEQGAGTAANTALAAMHGKRTGAKSAVGAKKDAAKAKDEAERQKISTKVQEIYTKTKTEVDGILNGLDAKVSDAFTKGEAEARAAFENNHQTEMQKWKDKRYEGVSGAAQWLIDKIKGPPPEVNDIYKRARDLYLQLMNKTISNIADIVGAELTKAKNRIDAGRTEINKYVAGLAPNLRKFGMEAQGQFASKFDELEKDVDSKQESVVSDLAQKYVEARNAIDERIKGMQDENKGLWDKAKEAVGGVIETILKLKDMLMGVLARAAGAIEKIIKDPIGFLGNLVNAVKAGVQRFAANILTHLKSGLMGWLFGEMAKAGIEMPSEFSIKAIFGLILQILGLTYANIRARIVKGIGSAGEKVWDKVEKAAGWIKTLVTEGPGALWKWIKDKVSDLKEQFLGPIKEFVVTKVIIAGITWLISLLNPASAFVKACKAIVDIVMFLVERASQIKAFVDSVLDSVESIAAGGAGAVAGLIENTLAKILPVVISFLASLLGVGGIAEKVKSVIQAIQKPINKALDFLIAPVIKFGKKLFGKLKAFGKKVVGKVKEKFGKKKDPDHDRKVAAGLAAIDQADRAQMKDGKLSRADAEKVARQVKSSHPIFKVVRVVDGGDRWNYGWEASPGEVKQGEKKAEGDKVELPVKVGDDVLIAYPKDWNHARVESITPAEPTDLKKVIIFCRLVKGGGGRGLPGDRFVESYKPQGPLVQPYLAVAMGDGPYKNLPDIKGVGPYKDFTRAQKAAIIAENMRLHGGNLVSDSSGAVLQLAKVRARGVAVDPEEVNIDHHWPKSKGGWNTYANARVLSFSENLRKLAKTPV